VRITRLAYTPFNFARQMPTKYINIVTYLQLFNCGINVIMNGQERQNLRNAFDSILRADYITLDNLDELGDLEDYFIDFFGILQSILQKQDNFISGRRGTGKTTNLLRGYYECLKTIAPRLKSKDSLIQGNKILPIYI
jgi:hypothetical protein